MRELRNALLISCLVGVIGRIITTPKPGLAWVLLLWIVLTFFGAIVVFFLENRGIE